MSVLGIKVGDVVYDSQRERTGVVKQIIEEDAKGNRGWPLPFAWVVNETDRWDVELRFLSVEGEP